MMKMDLVTLDNALDTSYVKHLLSGKSRNFVFTTLISSLQTLVECVTKECLERNITQKDVQDWND